MRAIVRRGRVAAIAVAGALVAALLTPPATYADPGWVPGIATVSAPGDHSDLEVAAGPDGSAAAIWLTGSSPRELMVAHRNSSGVWGAPTSLLPGSTAAPYNPRISVGADGTVGAVWAEFDGTTRQTRLAVKPPGQAWVVPSAFDTLPGGGESPEVAVGSDGALNVAWCPAGPPRRLVVASYVVGAGWGPPTVLAQGMDATCFANIAVGGDGSTTVSWAHHTAGSWTVRARHRAAGGVFGPTTSLSGGASLMDAPRLSSGPDGTAALVWAEYDGSAPHASFAVLPPGGSWSPPVNYDYSPGFMMDYNAEIAADGTVTGLWLDGLSVRAVDKPRSGEWGSVVTLGEVGTLTLRPRLAVSPDGTATAVWADSGTLIAATRPSGAASWSPAVQITDPGVAPGNLSVAAGSGGDAVAAWIDTNPGATDVVQARQLDGTGPVISTVNAPSSGVVGEAASFSAAVSDQWSQPVSVVWDFGDGITATGTNVSHTYGAAGRRTVTVTATDALGNATTKAVGTLNVAAVTAPPPPQSAPVILKFRFTKKKISISGKGKTARKTKAVLKVSAQARVKMTFKLRGAKGKWARKTTIRTHVNAKTGTTRVVVKARMGKKKRLRPGVYVVTVRAHNAAGRSAVKRATLRVIR